jgi:ATP-binding cassette subfamily B protein
MRCALGTTDFYFNRKDFEVNRYDETMGRWEGVATKSFTSMTALNFVKENIIIRP